VRYAIADSQQWLAPVILFGLLGCGVSISLKSEILRALAALARSAEVASNIWQTLELSQVSWHTPPQSPSTISSHILLLSLHISFYSLHISFYYLFTYPSTLSSHILLLSPHISFYYLFTYPSTLSSHILLLSSHILLLSLHISFYFLFTYPFTIYLYICAQMCVTFSLLVSLCPH